MEHFLKTQLTVKKNGDLSSPNYILTNTGSNEKNISITVGKNYNKSSIKILLSYFNSEIGILKSSHVGNIKDLLRAIESDSPTLLMILVMILIIPIKTIHITLQV